MRPVSARALAQRKAVEELEAVINPGGFVYFVDRTHFLGEEQDGTSVIDPVVIDGGQPLYVREHFAVLGPLKQHAFVAGLASNLPPHEAIELAMQRVRQYVHTDQGLPIYWRWL